MTEPLRDDGKSDVTDAQRDLLFKARVRGLVALGGALLLGGIAVVSFRMCSGDLPDADLCETSHDCEGVSGECLHAPTRNYCTHSCNRNEDCAEGFQCGAPAWEKTMRLVCLKALAPPPR